MKKVILLLCILFLTGCDVTYNVDLDSFDEKTYVISDESMSIITDGMTAGELHSYYLEKEVPYYYDQLVFSQSNVRFKDVAYYKVSDSSENEKLGLTFEASFKSYSNYSKSNLLWDGVREKSILVKSDGTLSIFANKFKLFDSYKNVDKLTVNLTTKHNVVSSNADKVSGNTYTWEINRDNYNDKAISFVMEKDGRLISNSKVPYVAIIVGIAFVGFIIFIIRKINATEKNEF